jgi:hypothetical protein
MTPAPDVMQLLELMKRWTGIDEVTWQILVSNPKALCE